MHLFVQWCQVIWWKISMLVKRCIELLVYSCLMRSMSYCFRWCIWFKENVWKKSLEFFFISTNTPEVSLISSVVRQKEVNRLHDFGHMTGTTYNWSFWVFVQGYYRGKNIISGVFVRNKRKIAGVFCRVFPSTKWFWWVSTWWRLYCMETETFGY